MSLVIILFVAAMLVIIAEFFVPGGLLGLFGISLLIGSAWKAYMLWPDHLLFIIMGELLGSCMTVFLGMYLMSHSKIAHPLMMSEAQSPDEGWTAPREDPDLVGQTGEVYSALRPAGNIIVDGRRIDAVSSGSFIDKGATVRVIEVEGHRVVVEGPVDG